MSPNEYKGWNLNEAVCPCDVHFLEWLSAQPANTSVLHMGTGLHHSVGLRHTGPVIGITYSEEERAAHKALVAEDASLAESYRLVHGDIYQMILGEMQLFDVISLFHLGEFHPTVRTNNMESELLSMLSRHLNPGGVIAFYDGSFAMTWGWMQEQVKRWAAAEGFVRLQDFKSLSFYSKP